MQGPAKTKPQAEPKSPESDPDQTIDMQETAGSGSGMMAASTEIKEWEVFEATHHGEGSTAEDF